MKSYGKTHIGQKRSMNQDYLFYSDTPVGIFPNLYIVADGMGGHQAGDKASSYAVERFVELAGEYQNPNIICAMSDIIETVNQELYHLAGEKKEYAGMGTTFVAACVSDGDVDVMNIGDSRLYYMGRNLKQITFDHSLVEELVRNGQLTKEEARIHSQKNVITRALGAEETVKPDFFCIEMEKEEQILLCSDGLTNMIDDKTLEQCLLEEDNIENTVNRMIELANEAGGMDNIAVVIAKRENEVTG